MTKVVAVVVTYNRCELLEQAITALKSIKEECDILIIDNASTDETKKRVKKYIGQKNIIYYNTGKNIGGAGGFNFGIRKAYEAGYDYIWIMDDDTIVQEDSLRYLLAQAEMLNNKFGWLSSMALWIDGKECRMNYHEISDNWNLDKKSILKGRILCQTATFVSLFINRSAVRQVGLPIKEYFIWGDDTEYTKRISKYLPCYFIPESQVTHKMNKNESTDRIEKISDEKRIERMFYSIRNDLCTNKRISKKREIIFILYQFTSIIHVIKSDNPYKLKKIKVIIKGIWHGIWFNPKIEKVS